MRADLLHAGDARLGIEDRAHGLAARVAIGAAVFQQQGRNLHLPAIQCGGLSFNTSAFSEDEAERLAGLDEA